MPNSSSSSSSYRLPSELIELIGSYLSNQEQYKCLFVCKNWFDPIHRSLYKTIQIKTRHQFKTLLPQLESNGKLVRSLYFCKSKHRVGVTRKELDQLAIVCPYIEILDFHQAIWKYIYHSNLLDQFKHIYQLPPLTHNLRLSQHQNQLTSLSLYGPIVSDYLFQQEELLKCTPHLVFLSFNSQQDKSHVIHVSITQLEFIHDSLPLLKELELSGSFKLQQITTTTTTITAAVHLTRFLLKATSISPQWIYYFAYKYPNLETLDLELTLLPQKQKEVDKSFSFLLKSCPNLNKIELDSSSAKTLMTKEFFDIADQHQHLKEIKMKDLVYNLVSRQDGFFDLLVKRGKRWISGLGTEVIESDLTIRHILESLVTLNQLTDLVLCCGHPYFDCELDLILDHCPNLIQLTIRSAQVIVSLEQQQQITTSRVHGLKSISFSTVSFSSCILFDYLSLKCPVLTKLMCYECDQKQGNVIQIHMPQHTFETISLNGIRLSLDQPNIRILSISQQQKKEQKRWYHANHPKIHRFNQSQTNQLQQYSIIKKPPTFRKVKDILFGYISIQCQSIQHWEFICETTYNEF